MAKELPDWMKGWFDECNETSSEAATTATKVSEQTQVALELTLPEGDRLRTENALALSNGHQADSETLQFLSKDRIKSSDKNPDDAITVPIAIATVQNNYRNVENTRSLQNRQPLTNAPIPTLTPIVPNKPVFITGWCNPVNGRSGCGEFEYCLVAVNRFVGKHAKKLNFEHKRIILDSSAFTRVSGFFPQFDGHLPVEEYSRIIIEADADCNLLAAVSQDYMCESAVLMSRNTTVKEQQERTIERYDLLLEQLKGSCIYLMPVLQGYEPHEYVECLAIAYSQVCGLELGQCVNVMAHQGKSWRYCRALRQNVLICVYMDLD
jgi:hypothetical protein